MPRKPVTEADVDGVEFSRRSSGEKATYFEGLAAEPHPNDCLSRAAMLVIAGDHRGLAGEHAAALELYEAAVADGGPTTIDARCHLVEGLLALDRTSEAVTLAGTLRKHGLSHEDHLFVGESFELADQAAAAIRWYTRGVLLALDDDPDALELVTRHLLVGRARVRDIEGFPPDDLDAWADELIGSEDDEQWQ